MPTRLKSLRLAAGLSCREVAAQAGLAPGIVSRIERDDRGRTAAFTLLRLADLFGVTTDWLIAGRGPSPKSDDVRERMDLVKKKREMASSREA